MECIDTLPEPWKSHLSKSQSLLDKNDVVLCFLFSLAHHKNNHSEHTKTKRKPTTIP